MRALIFMLLLGLIPTYVHAETDCGERLYDGRPICTIGILSSDFDDQDAAVTTGNVQERQNWCWAASISMIFKWYGFDVPQRQIVHQTFGDFRNAPAYGKQMTEQLNRTYKTDDGRTFRVRASVSDLMAGELSVDNKDIIESLEQGRPLVVGMHGHAMVLTAIKYVRDPAIGNPVAIVGAVVRDPWPGMGKRELSLAELHPIYVADISIEGQGEKGRVDAERIERCLDACNGEVNACLDTAKEEYETCSGNVDRACAPCSNYSGVIWETCDTQCERLRDRCSKDDGRKSEKCSRKGRRCMDRCK